MPKIEHVWRAGLWCLGMMSCAAWAQPEPASKTVQELIQSMKAQRELMLVPGAQPRSGGTSRPSAPEQPDMPPLLWSVSGLNDGYTAVLVIDRKVHVVQSQSLPVWIGGWRVRWIDAHGVGLIRPGKKLNLPAPSSASTTEAFMKALPVDARQDSMSMDSATDAPAAASAAGTLNKWPQDASTQAQQLGAPLPDFERSPSAQDITGKGVSKEVR